MDFLLRSIQKERAHFHKLSKEGQKLLKTIVLYELVNPIFGIFTTAFLWRETHDLPLLVIYYVLVNIGIPLGFYLNGILFRKFAANILSFFSLFLWGFIVSAIIFVPRLQLPEICLFGLFSGLAIGMFWANRNLLTLVTTATNTRIYFSGIESIISTTTKIIVPVLIGWFIVLGSKNGWYPTLTGYKVTAIIMLIIIGLYGIYMTSFKMKLTSYKQLFLHTVTKDWQKFRILQLVLGFLQGVITVLPVLMVLTLLGQEEALGTVQSVSAILSAIAVYKIAKTLGAHHRLLLLQVSIALMLIGSISFGIFFSALGVVIFYATQALSQPLWWMATSSLNYDLIEKDKNDASHFAYVCDQEIFLNVGRIIALLVFLGLAQGINNDFALRFTPLIFAFAQILMSVLTKSIDKKKE